MTTEARRQIRTALENRFEQNSAPAHFSKLSEELRDPKSGPLAPYRDSQILSVLYPMLNGGVLALTLDLQITKPAVDNRD